MKKLLDEIRNCVLCQTYLPYAPKLVLSMSKSSKIVIIGQAPGQKVHDSSIPWQDASGKELRRWLGVTDERFYDNQLFGLMPMGFCFPGTGKSGDLSPRKECAPTWHEKLLAQVEAPQLFLLIGQYAQNYYLKENAMKNLTETVKNYEKYLPDYLPLPHPSPRNRFWLQKNEWFEAEVIPLLRSKVAIILK